MFAARNAVLEAIAAINCDIRRLAHSSEACRRLMTIPGVGQLAALAFFAAIDGLDRFRTLRDVGPYLGLVPRCWKSGEIDYTGSISKCGPTREQYWHFADMGEVWARRLLSAPKMG
jgi:transposase